MLLQGQSYSSDFTYGYTGNAALWGSSWDMSSSVLGVTVQDGLDVSGVIYQYTTVKELEDDFTVTVQNKDVDGGYVWQDTEDWSGKHGIRIRKVIPLPYIPIAKFGKGEIATTGTGTVEDANVVYMYRYDDCFNPQNDPSCAGYVQPIPVIPEVKIYNVLEDEIVKDATKETNNELYDKEEEEEKSKSEEEEDSLRLEIALASSTNALTIANGFTQGSVVRSMNIATNLNNYYVANISGGSYKDSAPLQGGTIVDNRNAFKSLGQDNLMNQMIEEQYK